MSDVKIQFTVDSATAEAALKNLGVAMTGVEKKSKSSGLTLGNLKASWLAVVAVVDQVVKVIGASVKAYAEAELAEKKLADALKISGNFTQARLDGLNKFADQIQKTTVIEDDQARSLLALASNYGIANSRMEEAVQGAIGISRTFGVDAQTALRGVANAFQGNTEQLGRYIPELKSAKSETEKMAVLQRVLGDSFKNAIAESETYSGKMARLKNITGDLQEVFGKALLDGINPLLNALTELGTNSDIIKTFSSVVIIAMASISLAIKNVISFISNLISAIRNAGGAIADVFSGRWKEAGEKAKNVVIDLKDVYLDMGKNAVDVAKSTAEKLIQTWTDIEVKQTEIKKQGVAERRDILTNETEEERVKRKEAADKAAEIASQESERRVSAVSLMFGDLSSLTRTKSKELFTIGKAAGIAQATVDTYVAANKALASLPPPFNFIAMGAAIVAGIVNVAAIASQAPPAAAMGGIIPGSPGGTLVRVGEGNRSEGIIPLQNADAGSFGGRSEIHLHIGTLLADANVPFQLAKKIDEALYDLHRRGSSVAFAGA